MPKKSFERFFLEKKVRARLIVNDGFPAATHGKVNTTVREIAVSMV